MEILLQEHVDEGVVLLTLNRPEVMNAFNTELGILMNRVLDELVDDKGVRVLVITGSGRSFSAGGDLKERNGMTPEQWARQHRLFEEVHRKLRVCPKPIIAAVNGYALGGGFEMAISGDFCYASHKARFGFPEVTRGIIPGVGGTQTVGRFAPRGVALELLMTGRHITANEARQYGFVNRVTEPEELLPTVVETASLIAQNSPLAVRMAKKAYRLGADMPLEEGVDMSLECYSRTVTHPDREEGVRAFNEHRKPKFLDIY